MTRFVLERVTEPEIEPVTLAEMLQHLREYSTIDAATQAQIEALTTAAREWVEDYTGRALVDQQWRLTLGDRVALDTVQDVVTVKPGSAYSGSLSSLGGEILLRKSPALAIVSFVSVDAAGDETAVDPVSYELREADGKWPRVVALNGTSWSTGTYRIVFRAGYANQEVSPQDGAGVIPERYKQAIKLWVEANYDRDEKMMALLLDTAERLIRSERVEMGFG